MNRTVRVVVISAAALVLASGWAQAKAPVDGLASNTVHVIINGQELVIPSNEPQPLIDHNRILVPMRAILEKLGAKVDWIQSTRTATATNGVHSMSVTLDQRQATVDGETVALDVPAKTVSDRTFLPLRFTAQSLGASVTWDQDTHTASITYVPHIAVITDDTDYFTKLVQHDRSLTSNEIQLEDRVGKTVTASVHRLDGSPASSAWQNVQNELIRPSASAIIVPAAALQSNASLRSLAQSVLRGGKFVYAYGEKLDPASIGNLLGVDISVPVPDTSDKGPHKEEHGPSRTPTERHVVAVAVLDGKPVVRIGDIDSAGATMKLVKADVLALAAKWEADFQTRHIQPTYMDNYTQRDIFHGSHTPIFHRDDIDVDEVAAHVYFEYWLYQQNDDRNQRFDFFVVDPRFKVEPVNNGGGNGWQLIDLQMRHATRYSSDQLQNTSPPSGTGDTFTVQLPAAASWQFGTGSRVSLDTAEDYEDDEVWYTFSPAFPRTSIPHPDVFKPGTYWASTGTMASLGTTHAIHLVDYEGTIVPIPARGGIWTYWDTLDYDY